MIDRRAALMGVAIAGGLFAAPVSACRAPAPKNRRAYTFAIEKLFAAWWARDFSGFLEPFSHSERTDPLPGHDLFDAHFSEQRQRFRGDLLFNGASVVAQVITPQEPNFEIGICGGYAQADLFLIKFYPGLEAPVIEAAQFLYMDLLAHSEWKKLAR